jgi:NAD(P)-dependent dehydrogenase (short-subunit alcohol dehydrogenase family)
VSARGVALVTGDSSIGRAIGERLAARGDEIVSAAAAHASGRLDLLVCAGDDPAVAAPIELDVARAAQALEAQMLAPIALVRELWPELVEAAGAVIVVSSALGTYAAPGAAAFAAAQHALTGWSRVLRSAGLREGVRVLTLHPGPPAGRLAAEPGHVADVALRALARRRAEVWIPPAARLVAVAQSLAPGLYARHLAARVG